MKLQPLTKLATATIVALSILFVAASSLLAQKSEDERIAEINKENAEKGYLWTAGKTSVSGLSAEEKKRLYGLLPLPEGWGKNLPEITAPQGALFPATFDWRQMGGVTSVKNQLSCGSCWDFAAVAQLESHILIYDGRDEDLSEQQVLDCNTWGGSCGGGWSPAAYDLFENPGAVAESCYPYEGRDGTSCRQNRCAIIATISSYSSVANTVDAIKQALQTGPVATAMAALDNLGYYTGGCYNSPNSGSLNHMVLIVGWDDNACGSGEGAWIIKNSWGPGWGIGGFGYIKYGTVGIGSFAYQILYIPSTVLVRLDSPNGAEVWKVGENHDITWQTQRHTPDSLSILLSLNEGESYDYTIAHGLIGVSSYTWAVPELPVHTARVKILAYYGGRIGGFDMSEGNFTIKGKPYRYVLKTGGNVYPYSLPQWAAQTIQDAVGAALGGDTVRVAGNTYYESITVRTPVYLSGGWNGTFTARDPNAYPTTIQNFGSLVAFMNVASDSCGIEGFILKGGTGTNIQLPSLGMYGGAILSYFSSPTIRGNRIDSCSVAGTADVNGGGAIACYGGTSRIEGNEINGCGAQYGGGVYLYQATATLGHNRIYGCYPSAEYGGDKSGGGVYAVHSTVALDSNVIKDNIGYLRGGGVYLYMSPCSLEGDTIALNDGAEAGGGIYAQRSSLSAAHIMIRENTSGSSGGGIYQKAGSLDVSNSIITLNRAKTLGGGIYADSSWGGITNNTVDRNRAKYGGGNIFLYPVPPSAMHVRSNLITYGTKTGFQAMNGDNIVFRFNNCFGNAPVNVATLVPDSTNTSRNPHYADTSSFDYHLLVHSGGIDTGDPTGGADPDGSRADQGVFGGQHAFMAAPEYVKNLAALAANDSTIQLTWDAIAGAVSYYAVYGSETNGFLPDEQVFLGSVTAPGSSFFHHPVAGCRYYRVSAVNAAGYGGGYAAQAGACASGPDLIPPTVTVLHPNGGEFFKTGDTTSIDWHATDNRQVDSVSIYYTTDAGATYHLIAHGWRSDSAYTWVVPSAVSDSCLVKVVAYDPGHLTGFDTSDALFTIKDLTGIHDKGNGGGSTPRYVTALEQNYPNPFNGTTTISYSIASPCRVELKIYDPAGRVVSVLEQRQREPGRYAALWKGTDDGGRGVASGVYFCRLKAGKWHQTMKIIYVR